MRRPMYRGRGIENRGWTVVVLEHVATGELIRIYRRRRNGRWRYYAGDAPVRRRAIVGAAERYLALHASSSDERRAQLTLYPTSGRTATGSHPYPSGSAAGVPQTTAAPT